MASVAPSDVDLILLCTSSPDDAFGGACLVQAGLGASNAAAFDLTAACSGFVVGLVSATQYIRCGSARNVLVIGADALSRYVDWRDRGTCILFGDGAGAVLLRAAARKESAGGAGAVHRTLQCPLHEHSPLRVLTHAHPLHRAAVCCQQVRHRLVVYLQVAAHHARAELAAGAAHLLTLALQRSEQIIHGPWNQATLLSPSLCTARLALAVRAVHCERLACASLTVASAVSH